MSKTKHFDMDCGAYPRCFCSMDELYGLNIGDYAISANIRQANLPIDRIPFEDNFFDSVSAFDLLEQACVCWAKGELPASGMPSMGVKQAVGKILHSLQSGKPE